MIEFSATLGEIVEMKKGISYRSTELVDSEQDGITLINLKSFKKSGGFNENGLKYFCGNYENSNLLQPDDIIIANTDLTPNGDILGSPILLPKELHLKNVAFSVDTTRYRIIDTRVVPAYLYRLLQTPLVRIQFKRYLRGATVKRFAEKDAKKIELSFPSIEEQKRIVGILDKADDIKQEKNLAIGKRSELLRSLFHHMFGDPITNPKGWTKKPLGELVTIVRGGSPRPIKDYLGGSIPWIKIGDATKGDDVYLHQTKENITEAGLTKTRLLEKGSLIFANCGVSLGFARIITFQGCIHDGWLAFSDFNEDIVDKMFLLKALNCVTMYFRDTAPDGTQPNLNTSIMKKFEIILPPIKLQKEFAEYCHKEYKNSNYDTYDIDQLYYSSLQSLITQ